MSVSADSPTYSAGQSRQSYLYL